MHSSRILLMNNGVKLESQSWGNDHAPEIDYTGASMVEVVKGAECIRYGFGAMGGVVLLNDAPLPYGHNKPIVKGVTNIGYDTNARGISGSGSIEAGWKNFGMRLHGNYTRGGDYHTPEYIMNNTGYNNISMSAMGGFENKRITATVLTSLFYQRSGIYFGSQISDLAQLQERFRIGRPTESSLQPFSYEIGIPFQQSQHFTLKGEVKYRINPKQSLDLTLSLQENLRQEYENRMKKEWSVIPMQDLILKTYKADLSYRVSWKPYKMSTFAGLANTYQINYNFPGTKNPAFVPNFAALTMGGFLLQKATFFEKLQCELGLRYDFRVMSVSGYTTLNKYDYYDDFKVYSNFTSSFATHYQFNDNWDMRANIGWSWRPPDINELYAIGLQEGSYWVVGNRNLKSERGWKSILGARYRSTRAAVDNNFHDKDNYEKMQFYYHPDHLGSSSYITNLDGEVTQHIEYVPFGEVFIEERNNTWNTPYLFNAKEFDEETGMYYYGARYYEPRLSLWMSTDPLTEKSPNVSAYVYCFGNPLKYIDPIGLDSVYWGQDGTKLGTFGSNTTETKNYVIRTSQSTDVIYKDSNPTQKGKSNPISQKEYDKTVEEIKKGDFSSKNIVYIGKTERIKAMLESIKDDGTGGTSDQNNREYSGSFNKSGTGVVDEKTGNVQDPWKGNVSSEGTSSYHSHPSGTSQKNDQTASWQQPPSKQDISTAKRTEYVIGMGSKLIYRYDKSGVNAVFPISIFK